MGKIKKNNRNGQLITHDIAILSFLNFGNFFDVMHVSTFIFWRHQKEPIRSLAVQDQRKDLEKLLLDGSGTGKDSL